MSKILDKLGIYDLMGVLLSGISITFFTMIVLWIGMSDLVKVNLRIRTNEMFPFLIISYFVGLIFQEISSLLHKKILYPGNKLLIAALKTKKTSLKYITKYEKDEVYSYVKKVLNIRHIKHEVEKDEIIYNYCKYYMMGKDKMANLDKDQSISAFGRSLSLYFFMLGLAVFVLDCIKINHKNMIVVILLVISVILYYRCIRFAKMRYVKVFRSFYYDAIASEQCKLYSVN